MPEYIYSDDELDIDENEVFVGFIRKNCEQLIRCKDCNNCSAYGGGDAYCIAFRKWFSENFYCGWALRRVE